MKNLLLIISTILISSCASVYLTPEGQSKANKHQNIAILSPKVGFKQTKRVDADAMKEAQRTTSLDIQSEIYKWMLKRKTQGRILINIQDTEETNVLLNRNNYDGYNLTTKEICKILNVDAILYSNFNIAKPTSQGAAIVVGALFGVGLQTNKATAALSIKDCESNSMIWNYDHKFSGGLGSSSEQLVDNLMRNASKKLPYFK